MQIPSIPLSAVDVGADEERLVLEALRSGRLSNGPMLEQFEREFAARFGARHAIGVSNGTAAMHLSILAAGVRDGDYVITTPFSFIASTNPLLYERAIPVFVDIDPDTLAMDPRRAREAIYALSRKSPGWERLLPRAVTPGAGSLRAVISVDVFGRVAGTEEISDAARECGVCVIEDACEAVGATLEGKPAGRWGDIAAFSFFPNKQMTTGEGGLVLTDDDGYARTVRSLRSQGRGVESAWLRHDYVGYNYRLNDISAALGLAQVRRLDVLLRNRRSVAALYDERLSRVDGVSPLVDRRPESVVSPFIYVLRVDPAIDRDALARDLAARGVATRPYFWPIHLQPAYQERFAYERGDFPQAEAAGDTLLSIPFHGQLRPEEIDFVCDAIASAVQNAAARA